MMKIHELYARDITRRINPAVVVSEMKPENIRQEIEEYIFTNDITRNIYKFLNAIASNKEGKTGIWISGYYGSGKSHFIKYLFYCLNKKYREVALHNFTEAIRKMPPLDDLTIGKATLLKNRLDSLEIEEIIFNIDAVSTTSDGKDRITRVLLHQLNSHRGYNKTNIALALYLEKHLDNQGKFEAFKEKVYDRFGETWDDSNVSSYINSVLSGIIDVAHELDPNIDKASLQAAIMDTSKDYSIEFLINELKDYLKTKDENFRLLFLMDEVSQYIGSDSTLLLNLQTIVEEIGSKIGTKVWIACTAQQDLANLINNADSNTEDFGKILGRFDTQISLQSQDAAYITKKRVLDKNSNGVGELNLYYKSNKGAIDNQFYFNHDHYKNYKDNEEFILTYPFVPYQFQLVSDVFESFSNVGFVSDAVKNTERAILGITHFTADLCKDEETGYFVPFDLFFNDQLDRNLTHRARGILNRAYTIQEIKEDIFAIRVVKVLFMISNLGESQSVNFPANVENIAVLMMETADTAKQEMQTRVQKVLDILVAENIIQVSEGKYRFYKEDEVEVAIQMSKTPINNENRYNYLNDDIIKQIIKPERTISYGNNTFRMALKIDDKEIYPSGDFDTVFSFYERKDINNLALNTNRQTLVVCINEWFFDNTEFRSKLDEYVRTQVFIRANMANASGPREQTLKNFRENNEKLMSELRLRFEKRFLETSIISNQQVVTADELNGSNPKVRFTEMVNRHLERLYSKHNLSSGYATSNNALRASAESKQTTVDMGLTPAEQELNSYLNLLGDGASVGDVVKHFEKAPFGWKDISTLDIFVQLAKKGLRQFEHRSEEIKVKEFAEQALNSRERDAITVSKAKVYSQEETANFISMVNNDIFADVLIPSSITDFIKAVDTFKEKLKPKLDTLSKEIDMYYQSQFATHIKTFHKYIEELCLIRNPEEVVKRTGDQKNYLKTARDKYMQAAEFANRNFEDYQRMITFVEDNRSNFTDLGEDYTIRTEDFIDYINNDNEPWERFPQMRKLYNELNKAIRERVKALREEVVEKYEKIFEEIDKRKAELKDGANITTNKDYLLQQINRDTSLDKLKLQKLQANSFKRENLKKIEDRKQEEKAVKTGAIYTKPIDVQIVAEIEPTTISNEQELDAFLQKLKEQLMQKLKNNKKLWLN